MEIAEKPRIILTEPTPLPRDERCPRCDAKLDKRIDASGFGQVRGSLMLCGVCGYEFPMER